MKGKLELTIFIKGGSNTKATTGSDIVMKMDPPSFQGKLLAKKLAS